MYGLINKAVENFVTEKFGAETWEKVLEKSGVDAELFISMKCYPDEWTYKLIGAASEILALPADNILTAFGEYWIRFTEQEGYGHLLMASGSNLPEFLKRLDDMHAHISLTYEGARMPSFKCTELGPDRLEVDYYSERPGLGPMIVGLLKGLGTLFGNKVEVEYTHSRASGADRDRFLVHYQAA